MEYVYSALLLHSAGKKIDEGSVSNVLKAAGIEPDEARVKALVSALEGVDIQEAIRSALQSPVAPSGGAPAPSAPSEKKEEKAEEKGPSEEEAMAGLGALFG